MKSLRAICVGLVCFVSLGSQPAVAQFERTRILKQIADSKSKFTTLQAWDGRRRQVIATFLQGAGLAPMPVKTPLNPSIRKRRVYEGYTVDNVVIETFPGFYCTGNLYRPLAAIAPGPGILCPHGHFPDGGRMRPDQQYRCAHLARMGATVFSYSMVGWQDSQQTTHDDPNVLTLQTWNSIRALDFLCRLPEVDAHQIGATGASGGGTQTFFLAAIDDRIKASVPAVIVYPWCETGCCLCEGKSRPIMSPVHSNAVELSACVAPRPQLYISVGGDETRDFPTACLPFVRGIYGLYGKTDNVANMHFQDENHDYGPSKRKAAYAFFSKHLGLVNQAEDTSKIAVEPEQLMRAFDDDFPLPPRALKGSAAIAAAWSKLRRHQPAEKTRTASDGESLFFSPPGFAAEGKVARATGGDTAPLRLQVVDVKDGKPTPCRINVIGPDGNFYQPEENPLSKYSMNGEWPKGKAWGNRRDKAPYRYMGRFFYTTGNVELKVPAGNVRIEVCKGFEYRPVNKTIAIVAGKPASASIQLERTAPMARSGYFAGDPHLHFPRVTESDDRTAFDLLEAEDVWFGALLGYNEPAGPYPGVMEKMASPQMAKLGAASIRSRGNVSVLSGQEYRTVKFGHMNLYMHERLVFEGKSFNADDGPAYGQIASEVRAAGGYAFMAHGGYGQEIYADAALGAIDAVELLQFGVYRGIGLDDWYHMLNVGYRFPCVGASDYPACRWLSDCRTYARIDPVSSKNATPTFQQWLQAAREGKSFVTTGPLLNVDIDGRLPGETIELTGSLPKTIILRWMVTSEVAPVDRVDVIVNGAVVHTTVTRTHEDTAAGLPVQRSGAYSLSINEPCWIAVRACSTTPGGRPNGEAHTNPVYVNVNEKRAYLQRSLDVWVSKIDQQINEHARRKFGQKSAVMAYFQRARDALVRIRAAGGIKSNEDIATQINAAPTDKSPTQRFLLDDVGRLDVTDAELKEFLKPVPATKPSQAIKQFEAVNGFSVQLVAAEPMVQSPVAAAFDENGNLFVCEMRDYPYKPKDGEKPIGRIRLLRDTDGDGVFDEAHVFADQMLWAAGVVPWRGGVFVAAPPDIWYLKDTDGDFKADTKRRVFTGFGTANQQAMVNNLQMGLDHQIYGATAGNGGVINNLLDPSQPPVNINGRDFRFDPITGKFQAITGTVQFGNTFDDWGNRFVCSESHPLKHVVLPDEYLSRNPFLAAPLAIHDCAPAPVPIHRISPVERWRQIRSGRRLAKGERAATSAGASHHVVDAGAGVTVYRGGAYPANFYGTVFTGDGQNNLVHRRTLISSGVTFESKRSDEGTEFLRSPDIWFRPVNFVNAPDGTLYCIDMCREVLESIHIPLDVVKHLDLKSGRDNGRVYRIAPPAFRYPGAPNLTKATIQDLVDHLASPHGWYRDTASRLLFERQDVSATPALRKLAANSLDPRARLLALWSLFGLKSLDDSTLLAALSDRHSSIRENALRMAENRVKVSPDVASKVLALASDNEIRVRFQAAFTMGELGGTKAASALATLARRDGADPWMRTAILSSALESGAQLYVELLGAWLQNRKSSNDSGNATLMEMLNDLALLVGSRNRTDEITTVLNALAAIPVGSESAHVSHWLRELGRGLKRTGGQWPAANGPGTALVERALAEAREKSLDRNADSGSRLAAIELLGCAPRPMHRQILAGLLRPDVGAPLQIAAVRALGDDRNSSVSQILLDAWRSFTPDIRRVATEAMLTRDDRTIAMLTAAKTQPSLVADVDANRRELLRNHRSAPFRTLANAVFGAASNIARQSVVASYRSSLQTRGNVLRGLEVFEKNCSPCHRLQSKGNDIGPNLASSALRDPAALLNDILDPNLYVPPQYIQYVVVDTQGRTVTGLLTSQTAASITLKREGNQSVTIRRSEIEELAATGKSLMPEGLEKAISPESMADLLAFLKANAKRNADDPRSERDFGTLPGLIEPGR